VDIRFLPSGGLGRYWLRDLPSSKPLTRTESRNLTGGGIAAPTNEHSSPAALRAQEDSQPRPSPCPSMRYGSSPVTRIGLSPAARSEQSRSETIGRQGE